jgi:hypothetical protein
MEPSAAAALADIDGASVCFLVGAILFALRRHLRTPTVAFWNAWAMRLVGAAFCSFFTDAILRYRRPLPLLIATFLSVIFLLESVRLWNLTSVFAAVDLPIFPKFRRCTENFIWPIGKFFDDAREFLLANGFRASELLRVGDDEYSTHCLVFYDKNRYLRMQIIFNTLQRKRQFLNCVLTSFAVDGTAIVTGNTRTISASFYPETWRVKHCPMASPADLLKIHGRRIAKLEMTKFDAAHSMETINGEQHQLELENCRLGYCEKLMENSHVTLTYVGRYHLWCDMLHYSYFGRRLC